MFGSLIPDSDVDSDSSLDAVDSTLDVVRKHCFSPFADEGMNFTQPNEVLTGTRVSSWDVVVDVRDGVLDFLNVVHPENVLVTAIEGVDLNRHTGNAHGGVSHGLYFFVDGRI